MSFDDRDSSVIRRTIVLLVCAGGSLLAFLLVSLALGFSNWPWTVTETYETGQAFGFAIGDDKN